MLEKRYSLNVLQKYSSMGIQDIDTVLLIQVCLKKIMEVCYSTNDKNTGIHLVPFCRIPLNQFEQEPSLEFLRFH